MQLTTSPLLSLVVPVLLAIGAPTGAQQAPVSAGHQAEVVQGELGTSLPEIPKPNTEGMEPAVASLLQESYDGLLVVMDPDADLDGAQRAERMGAIGEVFHAHAAIESAVACYRRAIDLDPQSSRWRYLLGVVLKGQGSLLESLKLLESADQLEPSPFTKFRIGQIYLQDGRVDEALEALTPLQETEGLQAAVRAELGQAALLIGDYSAAIAHLAGALERQPEAIGLHFPLSQAFRGVGDLTAAQLHAELGGQRKVRAFDPVLQQVGERSVSSETYITMGAQALRTGRTEVATAAYRKAVELNPANQRGWMNLGVLAMEAAQHTEAEGLFRRALELDPQYGFAHFNLAEVLVKLERGDEAIVHYRAAVDSNPKNIEFGIAYADQLMRAGDWSAAADQYHLVAAETPDFARPRYLRALALVANRELDSALASIQEAWEIDPKNPSIASAFVRLASTATADDRVKSQAQEVATQLFQQLGSVERGEQLAMALAANGQIAEALQVQESVLRALASADAPDGLVAFAQGNLDQYRAGKSADQPWPAGSF